MFADDIKVCCVCICGFRPCVMWLRGAFMFAVTQPPPQDSLCLCPGTADLEITLLRPELWCWEIKVFQLHIIIIIIYEIVSDVTPTDRLWAVIL